MTDAVEPGTQLAGGTPARPFTIGLVGASNIAMTWMLPAFAALGIGVRGLYDNEPRRFSYWADSDIEGQTTNLDRLLAGDIDAVYISTRNDQHLAETVAAANAGKHILVEKPMALVADAQAMIDAATQAESSSPSIIISSPALSTRPPASWWLTAASDAWLALESTMQAYCRATAGVAAQQSNLP